MPRHLPAPVHRLPDARAQPVRSRRRAHRAPARSGGAAPFPALPLRASACVTPAIPAILSSPRWFRSPRATSSSCSPLIADPGQRHRDPGEHDAARSPPTATTAPTVARRHQRGAQRHQADRGQDDPAASSTAPFRAIPPRGRRSSSRASATSRRNRARTWSTTSPSRARTPSSTGCGPADVAVAMNTLRGRFFKLPEALAGRPRGGPQSMAGPSRRCEPGENGCAGVLQDGAAQAGRTSARNASMGRVLSTSARAKPARRAMSTPKRMFSQDAVEWASQDTTNRMPRSRASRTSAARGRAGEDRRSSRSPRASPRPRPARVHVAGDRRATQHVPAERVAPDLEPGLAHGGDHAVRHLAAVIR